MALGTYSCVGSDIGLKALSDLFPGFLSQKTRKFLTRCVFTRDMFWLRLSALEYYWFMFTMAPGLISTPGLIFMTGALKLI